MTLSLTDRRAMAKFHKICEIANVFLEIDNIAPALRPVALHLSVHHVIVGHVVSRYTLMDDLLNNIIIFFFGRRAVRTSVKAQRPKKLRVFRHHILDEMYLLKKMQIVHEIQPIAPKVSEHLRKLNAIRNAMTHSFYPEHRKEYRKTKKVTYSGRNIFTPSGLTLFEQDWLAARKALEGRVPGHRAWERKRAQKILVDLGIGDDALQLLPG